jgi:hypothetical protein
MSKEYKVKKVLSLNFQNGRNGQKSKIYFAKFDNRNALKTEARQIFLHFKSAILAIYKLRQIQVLNCSFHPSLKLVFQKATFDNYQR